MKFKKKKKKKKKKRNKPTNIWKLASTCIILNKIHNVVHNK